MMLNFISTLVALLVVIKAGSAYDHRNNRNPVNNWNHVNHQNPVNNWNHGNNRNPGNWNHGNNQKPGQNWNHGNNQNPGQNWNHGNNQNPGQNWNHGNNQNAGNVHENYCSREYMCGHQKNIMCNAHQGLGPQCRSASIVPISYNIRTQFLRGHNQKRSLVAQGRLGGFYGSASRMATMVWDPELEKMALQNALQCKEEHDYCHKTRHFLYTGQNLAKMCQSPRYNSIPNAIEGAINGWFDEYKIFPQQWLHSYGNGPQPHGMVGDFSQMIKDKAFAVGCAIVKSITYHDGTNWSCYHIACNYATTNIANAPVYEIGQMGCKCRTGMNHDYQGLCSSRENYYDDTNLFHWN